MVKIEEIIELKIPEQKNNYYVNNVDFYNELKDWIIKREKSPKLPITEELVKKIKLLVEGYSFRPNFINYSFKEQMCAEAIYTCIRYADRFNYKKYFNPFAYFTRIAWSSFVKIIIQEKKYFEMKKTMIDNFYFDSLANMQGVKIKKSMDYKSMFKEHNEKEFTPCKVKYKGKVYNCDTEEKYKKISKKIKKLNKK